MSVASASMMTELLSGKTISEAEERMDTFIGIMQGKETPDRLEEYEDLVCFQGVIKYPERVKCVTLPWHAVKDQLERIRKAGS